MFAVAQCAGMARDQFLSTAAAYRLAVIAYCLMPDHMHALVEGLAEDSDFRRFVSMFKQRSTFASRRLGGAPLWQEGYYDHVVRAEQSYLSIAAYILNNPVRACLCRTVTEYPFLGSDRYTIEELVDAISIDPMGRRSRP